MSRFPWKQGAPPGARATPSTRPAESAGNRSTRGAGAVGVKHAGPGALDRLEPVLRMIRARTALTERSRGVFYRKRDPFLHFHEDPAGLFCDVKIDGRFRRHSATTKDQQRTLVARVVKLASIPLPQRGRGQGEGAR